MKILLQDPSSDCMSRCTACTLLHGPCRDALAGPRAAGALGHWHWDKHPQQCWPWTHQPAFLWGHIRHFKGQGGCLRYIYLTSSLQRSHQHLTGDGNFSRSVGVNPEHLPPRQPLLLRQLIPAGSMSPASLQPLSQRAGKQKKYFMIFNASLLF